LPPYCQVTTSVEEASNWLQTTLENNTREQSLDEKASLGLPMKRNETFGLENYMTKDLHEDQKEVAGVVMYKLQEWFRCVESGTTENYTPLRLTVCGEAGSGKTVLINTLVTLIRRLTGTKNSVHVCGPTGSAAFNAGGLTCQRLFHMPVHKDGINMSAASLKSLMQELTDTIAIIVDERSMVSAQVLGMMEQYSRQAAFNGQNSQLDWGGIPIILVIGDDYQLPSIDEGSFYCFGNRPNKKHSATQEYFIQHGLQQFLALGKDVMQLTSPKRVHDTQGRLKSILQGVRGTSQSYLSIDDAEYLCSFHLQNKDRFNSNDISKIEKDALYLYANKEPKDAHNSFALLKANTADNPVAKLKASTTKRNGMEPGNAAHYEPDRMPPRVNLCKTAKVQLTGYNPRPEWGLYHGSRGTVIDIVFALGESPNNNDLPLYVLVDFPQYCGPAFDIQHPTFVPVASVKMPCKFRNCCDRTFIPLRLAYAQTLHTFQGQNAGPTMPGQPPNSISCIICDPGTRLFESKCVGLFYTLLSRITSLGDDSDKFSSTIYFIGDNMTPARILDITRTKKDELYHNAFLRHRFVTYLNNNMHTSRLSGKEREDLFEWAETTY
jgi:hypothetical protein